MLQPFRKLLALFLLSILSSSSYSKSPYLLLISIDGFRHDYPQKFNLKFFKKLQKQTPHSNQLYPVYPTKTFPNHLSTITGTYPDEHGIIGNIFYDKTRAVEYSIGDPVVIMDPRWYQKQPLWNELEAMGIKTASYNWPGSEVLINGGRPTYVKKFNHSTPKEVKLQQTLKWLSLPEKNRPHFISLYFPSVDSAGHSYGPDSEKTKAAAKVMDRFIEKLFREVKKIEPEINIIISSDHGMTTVQEDKVVLLKDFMDPSKPIHMSGNGSLIHLYFKTTEEAENFFPSIKQHSHIKAFLKKDIPEKYHLKKAAHTGDIILVATYPYCIIQNEAIKTLHPIKGDHGYDPDLLKNMLGIYFEEGPDFVGQSFVRETKDIYSRMKALFMKPLPVTQASK